MSLIHFSGFPYPFQWRKDILPVLSSQWKAVLVKLIKAESETRDWLVWPTLQRGSPDAGRICRSRICHGLLLPSAALRTYWPSAKASLRVLWQLLGRCQPVTGHDTGPVLLGLYNKGLGTAEIFLKIVLDTELSEKTTEKELKAQCSLACLLPYCPQWTWTWL